MKRILFSIVVLFGIQSLAAVNVVMKTSKGDIEIILDDVKAPKSTANFLKYVDSKFYDGTVFHRVIKNFMIQGGGFELKKGSLVQKVTQKPVVNEAKNGLKNDRGTIAMARTSDPHSATSQFFINHKNNNNLNNPSFDGWGYAVFGKITEPSFKVLDKIAAVSTGNNGPHQNVPTNEVKIISVRRK